MPHKIRDDVEGSACHGVPTSKASSEIVKHSVLNAGATAAIQKDFVQINGIEDVPASVSKNRIAPARFLPESAQHASHHRQHFDISTVAVF